MYCNTYISFITYIIFRIVSESGWSDCYFQLFCVHLLETVNKELSKSKVLSNVFVSLSGFCKWTKAVVLTTLEKWNHNYRDFSRSKKLWLGLFMGMEDLSSYHFRLQVQDIFWIYNISTWEAATASPDWKLSLIFIILLFFFKERHYLFWCPETNLCYWPFDQVRSHIFMYTEPVICVICVSRSWHIRNKKPTDISPHLYNKLGGLSATP